MPPTKRPAAPSPNTLGADDLATGHRDEGPSETIARYLEAIFYIDGEGEVVRAARLAEWIGVSQPKSMKWRRMSRCQASSPRFAFR